MVASGLWVRSWALVAVLVGGWSSGAFADTKTWTGAIDALWSTPGNWAGGTPAAADRVVFPVTASNRSNTNDLAAGTVFYDLTFLGNGYTITGNTIGLSDGITVSASVGTGNLINADLQLTAPQTLSGIVPYDGGLLTIDGDIDLGSNAITITAATVNGVISGTGTMTMGNGSSDMTRFTGNNTYSGLTTVSGRGQIDGNQPGSDVQVTGNPQPRLGGNGTVGSVTLVSSAPFSSGLTPGAGGFPGLPGKLTTANLTFGDGSFYEVQLNGSLAGVGYDQVVVNGTVTIGSNVSLNSTLDFSPGTGQTMMLIDNDGVDAVSGAFAGLPEGAIVTMNGSEFQISYGGGSGNDVVLTVTAAAKTWTGAVNNLWSEAGNWLGGVPGAGSPLVFPSGAVNLANINNLPPGAVYKLMVFTGNGYTITGNTIGLSDGITVSASVGTSNLINADLQLTAPQTLSGIVPYDGGLLTIDGDIDLGSNAITITAATVNGVISGTGTMTMGNGSSDMTRFTGNNTYSGLTTVSGRGQIDGNQPGSDVQVTGNPQPRLGGNGTVGSVTLVSSAPFSSGLTPGAGGFPGLPGKLTTANLTFGDGSFYEVQLNGSLPGVGYDQVVVNGTVTIGSNVNLTLSLGFTPARGQIFVIVDNDGGDAVNGVFSGHPQGSTLNIGPYPFEMSYIGKTGNEIILTSLSGDPLNAAPVAVDDNYATPQDSSLSVSTPGVLLNDSDPDLDPVAVALAPDTTGQGGTLSVNADGSFLYQPPSGFNGLDSFTYVISDGHNATDLATVTINVQAPPGVCCAPDETCTVTTQAECVPPSLWHGEQNTCAPNLCLTISVPFIPAGGEPGFFGAVPNPFVGSAKLWYQVSKAEVVELSIIDVGGHLVTSFAPRGSRAGAPLS